MLKSLTIAQNHLTYGLRSRLTLTYIVFFTLLLALLGVFFRETLQALYDSQLHNILNEEWGTVRGYLRIEKGKPVWYYDRNDPEEAIIIDRLRQVYLLTDASGTILEIGPDYNEIAIESVEDIKQTIQAKEPVWKHKRNSEGTEYLIRAASLMSEGGIPYYVAIGRSFEQRDRLVDQFMWYYWVLLPAFVASGGLLGWFMAGKALSPVNEVARTAQRITGSNLAVQIPLRGAGDELDRLIESFNRMIERLEASFTQMRQFSTDVSHELRTPLTAIRGQLEVALLSAKTPDQYQEAILNALEDVERLSQTIRVLLQLSQAESGRVALRMELLDLCGIARRVLEQFEIPAETGNLRLTSSLPPRCMIEGDRIQMERLISNLLANAIKYTPEGGSVHLAIARRDHEADLIVKDTGVGIPADHLPHIFDRFYRVPNIDGSSGGRPERGLGLGLSFVAWIVKAHRGRIDVQSAPGKGTRFTVTLPAGPLHREPADAGVRVDTGSIA
jgi:heavy metal sensor kinase